MSMSPRLPPECIQLIAEHLLAAQAPCTLCSLLRTSKSMFTLVAPIVFREPFHQDKAPEEKLCRLLLGSMPVERLPKELHIAYFPELSLSSPPNATQHFVDYASFIRHIHFISTSDHSFSKFEIHCSAPERIQSIDIPLSDIDRYVSVVDRFHSLSSVNFITDFTADIQQHPTNTPSQQLTAKAFKTMAHFVEEMVRLFRTQLRTVTLVKHLDHECLPEIPQRFFQMLPPLDQPQQLNSTNWDQLIILLELTCLDRVKKISTPRGEEWHEMLSKTGPMWPRCRSLETLEMRFYPSPMLIQWAIKEKEERQKGLECPGLSLKRIHVHQYVDMEILHNDDLLPRFSDTLEEVYCECRDWTLGSYPPTPRTFPAVASQRITMPKLNTPLVRTIQLVLVDASTNFDNDSYAGDDGRLYNYDHLPNWPRHWSWNWHLPCLISLDLGLGFPHGSSSACWTAVQHSSFSLIMMGPETPREGRLVSESDLGSCRSESGYVSCPRLEQLTLTGP
ncbi:MAG: hypothetical protein BYD32DRAFT_459892 [Podila humilis]|nr:MAG: hypothetical protein BYD32DRAFT_459892 [Podila humilis]